MLRKLNDANVEMLFKAMLSLNTLEECYDFFEDICTVDEIQSIAKRLRAAKMLKEQEDSIKGTVKVMFQPAEEILEGSLDMIKNGNIAYEMCKPMNIYLTWFMKIFSKKVIATLLRFWPIVLIAFFLPEPFRLSLPSSFTHFILFLISLVLALFITCILILFIHIITFYTLKDKGATNLIVTFGEIFTGGVIPIVFMPKVFQIIAYLLPFRYVGDLPFRIYNGTLDISTSLINIGMQIIWIVLLGIISYKLILLSNQNNFS